jgi:hypothetical protein
MDEKQDFQQRQRNRLSPLTAVRAHRLEHGITLFEAATRAGLTSFRVSVIERDPSTARPGELDVLRLAVDAIAAERRSDAA